MSLSVDDRIFLGEGLFETICVTNHHLCYPLLHWQRMQKGAATLNIQFEISRDAWIESLKKCIKESQFNNGGVKVILSGGGSTRGLTNHGEAPYLLIKGFTYPTCHDPLSLVSASWLRDANNPIYQLKSVNYLESILARRQALAVGADDVLFFNTQHRATETTVANLFIIKQDQLYTPRLEEGVLAGITRNRLITICSKSGVSCTEKSLDLEDISDADVLFTTNALQGIRVVKSLNGLVKPIEHPLLDIIINLLVKDETNAAHL